MPSPVQTTFPGAKASRARGANSSQPEPAGEGFHNELLRQRRTDANEKPDAAKAESKKSPSARKPSRQPREEPTPPPQSEVEVRAATTRPAGEVATDADANEAAALDDDAVVVAAGADEDSSPTDAPQSVDPAAASAGAGMVSTPAQAVAPQLGGSDPAGGNEAVTDDVLETLAGAPRTSGATVYHAAGGATPGESDGFAPGGVQVADGGSTGLFADASGGAEPSAGEGDAGQQGRFQMPADADAEAGVAESLEPQPEVPADTASAKPAAPATADAPSAVATVGLTDVKAETRSTAPLSLQTPAGVPEARFATDNHEKIVTSMRSELMPNGGSMRIRLDPPQLGAMQVTVQIQDGVITASFETSSDEATRLLGHSLNQLKSVLESHGVSVDKLQVQQVPRDAQTFTANDDGQKDQGRPSQDQEHAARQEQQRREMLRKMWQRLAGGQDPLDLIA